MNEFKLIENEWPPTLTDENMNDVILHEEVTNILFKYKEEIHKKLIDLRGLFLIDHFAIKIIDPDNKIVIFSLTPSVEYNLILHGLWKHDKSFNPHFKKNNSFYFWEEAYSEQYFEELKSIKEIKHGFTLGFDLVKKEGLFQFIYSFATRSKNTGLRDYYVDQLNELFTLGDYGYRLIRDTYQRFCNPLYTPPYAINKYDYQLHPHLRLIKNSADVPL